VAKVKNVATGIYADGEIYVLSGEVIEVSDEKAKYLCDKDTAGSFERVVDSKPAPAIKATR